MSAARHERPAAFRHDQAKELKRLKFEINKLLDRSTKLHQWEFEVLRIRTALPFLHCVCAAGLARTLPQSVLSVASPLPGFAAAVTGAAALALKHTSTVSITWQNGSDRPRAPRLLRTRYVSAGTNASATARTPAIREPLYRWSAQ